MNRNSKSSLFCVCSEETREEAVTIPNQADTSMRRVLHSLSSSSIISILSPSLCTIGVLRLVCQEAKTLMPPIILCKGVQKQKGILYWWKVVLKIDRRPSALSLALTRPSTIIRRDKQNGFLQSDFYVWSKTLKGKKWHNKFPHFSISEAAVTSTIIIMTRSKGDIWSHEYEKAAKILKTISTHKVDDADPIYWEFNFFFVIIRTPLQFPLRAVEIGLGILHFCYQIKKNRTKRERWLQKLLSMRFGMERLRDWV